MSEYAEGASRARAYLSEHVCRLCYLEPASVERGAGWSGLSAPNWCDCSHCSCPQSLALPSPVNLCQEFGWRDTVLTWQVLWGRLLLCAQTHIRGGRKINTQSLGRKNKKRYEL